MYSSDEAVAERIRFFIKVGLPATRGDPADRQAIADGACRLATDAPLPGWSLWRAPVPRAARVCSALARLPADADDATLAAAARERLAAPCARAGSADAYAPAQRQAPRGAAASAANWAGALCTSDGAATLPHQRALTAGYLCLAACEAQPPADVLYSFGASPDAADAAAEAVCAFVPKEPATLATAKDGRVAAMLSGAREACGCAT